MKTENFLKSLDNDLMYVCNNFFKHWEMELAIQHFIKQKNESTLTYYFECSNNESHYIINQFLYKKFNEIVFKRLNPENLLSFHYSHNSNNDNKLSYYIKIEITKE